MWICGRVLDTESFCGRETRLSSQDQFFSAKQLHSSEICSHWDWPNPAGISWQKKHTGGSRVSLIFWTELLLQCGYSIAIIWLLNKKSWHWDNLFCAGSWLVSKTYTSSCWKTDWDSVLIITDTHLTSESYKYSGYWAEKNSCKIKWLICTI